MEPRVDEMINGFTAAAYRNKKNTPRWNLDSQGAQSGAPVEGVAKNVVPNDGPAPFDAQALSAIDPRDRRWSWVTVDRSAIQHNVIATKRLLDTSTRLMAVVKADAYGHGAIDVAKTAVLAGATYLGVATIDEGIELRRAGLREPILVLAEPPAASADLLLYYELMPSVYTAEFAVAYAEAAYRHGLKAPYHLAVNTGMNRIGVRHDEVVEFVRSISFHPALQLVGSFTHFATADADQTLDLEMQIGRFVGAMRSMEQAGIDPGLVHCDNSAAIYRFPKTHFDMVRLGISLYGYHPARDTRRFVDLKPAMRVHARITNVTTPALSEGVSYGFTYRSPGSVKVCTVPLGYADGLSRLLSNHVCFAYQDQEVNQVGNICMDQCMFEVNLRPRAGHPRLDPQIGDEVLIAGPHERVDCSIETMASKICTIPHEVCIGFAQRMPRFFG